MEKKIWKQHRAELLLSQFNVPDFLGVQQVALTILNTAELARVSLLQKING